MQRTSFTGDAMDEQDAQWYNHMSETLPAPVDMHVDAMVPTVSGGPSSSSSSRVRSRQLVRFDSEQAVSLFLNHSNADDGMSTQDET